MSKKNSSVNLKNGFKDNKDLADIFLNFKNKLNNKILILDLLNLNFRKVEFKKKKNCICESY